MNQNRQELAESTMQRLYGVTWNVAPRPGEPPEVEYLNRQLAMNAFADSWARSGIEPKTKEMITIGMLIATCGADTELRSHVSGALLLGITKSEIVEIFIHAAAYLGSIRTAAAWSVARRVLADAK
jgi:4-carboxymuconolactone decarboxylase